MKRLERAGTKKPRQCPFPMNKAECLKGHDPQEAKKPSISAEDKLQLA